MHDAVCMMHAACMNRHAWNGMHEPACMLQQQLLLLRACVRACVVARVIGTMYQLIHMCCQLVSANPETGKFSLPVPVKSIGVQLILVLPRTENHEKFDCRVLDPGSTMHA